MSEQITILRDRIEEDLLAVIKFKNRQLYDLKGQDTLGELSKKIGVSITAIVELMNLKHSPIKHNGDYSEPAKKIAEYFGYLPEDLFPASLYRLTLPKAVYRTFPSEKLASLAEARSIRYLPEPEEAIDNEKLGGVIDELLQTLNPQQRQALTLYFGLHGQPAMTLREVAQKMNVTAGRVQQVVGDAIRKLRHPSRARRLRDFLYPYETFEYGLEPYERKKPGPSYAIQSLEAFKKQMQEMEAAKQKSQEPRSDPRDSWHYTPTPAESSKFPVGTPIPESFDTQIQEIMLENLRAGDYLVRYPPAAGQLVDRWRIVGMDFARYSEARFKTANLLEGYSAAMIELALQRNCQTISKTHPEFLRQPAGILP